MKLGAASPGVEAKDKDVVVHAIDFSVCIEVGARSDRDGGVSVGGEALVARVEASRLVRIVEPGVGDCSLTHEWLVVGVIPIACVIAEERLDRATVAALPRGNVTLEPARDVLTAHCPSLNRTGG